jgi:hypothetical protein
MHCPDAGLKRFDPVALRRPARPSASPSPLPIEFIRLQGIAHLGNINSLIAFSGKVKIWRQAVESAS